MMAALAARGVPHVEASHPDTQPLYHAVSKARLQSRRDLARISPPVTSVRSRPPPRRCGARRCARPRIASSASRCRRRTSSFRPSAARCSSRRGRRRTSWWEGPSALFEDSAPCARRVTRGLSSVLLTPERRHGRTCSPLSTTRPTRRRPHARWAGGAPTARRSHPPRPPPSPPPPPPDRAGRGGPGPVLPPCGTRRHCGRRSGRQGGTPRPRRPRRRAPRRARQPSL